MSDHHSERAKNFVQGVSKAITTAVKNAQNSKVTIHNPINNQVRVVRAGDTADPNMAPLYVLRPGMPIADEQAIITTLDSGEVICLGALRAVITDDDLAVIRALAHAPTDADYGDELKDGLLAAYGANLYHRNNGSWSAVGSRVVVVTDTNRLSISTNNRNTYQTVQVTDITLPAGTWTVYAILNVQAYNTGNDQCRIAIDINGTTGGAIWPIIGTGDAWAVSTSFTHTIESTGGAYSITGLYYSPIAGTVNISAATITAIAIGQ